MIRTIKHYLYLIKIFIRGLHTYPTSELLDVAVFNYDTYWDERQKSTALPSLSDWQRARADIFSGFAKSARGKSIVDVGCGNGSVLLYLQKALGFSEVLGYEHSARMLTEARNSGLAVIDVDLAQLEELPRLKKADYYLLFEVLEHIPHAERLLKVAFDRASQGVCFSIPNTGYVSHRLRLVLGKFPLQWAVHPGEHVRFWTYRDLQWWLQAQDYSGYSIIPYRTKARGIPILYKLWPSLFSSGFVVYIPKM